MPFSDVAASFHGTALTTSIFLCAVTSMKWSDYSKRKTISADLRTLPLGWRRRLGVPCPADGHHTRNDTMVNFINALIAENQANIE